MDRYLVIPLVPLNEISINEALVLSQLIYMKKAFNEIYPSNAYLSKILSMSISSVQRSIAKLSQNHYITLKIINRNKRIISLSKKSLTFYGITTSKNNSNTVKTEINPALLKFWASLEQ
jgi:DNA-binding MarR family transcriptional regulator